MRGSNNTGGDLNQSAKPASEAPTDSPPVLPSDREVMSNVAPTSTQLTDDPQLVYE